jgi:hypothetical protein
MLKKASHRYGNKVKYRFCEAREAMRLALEIDDFNGRLSLTLESNKLTVFSNIPTFGPQPFLAIKTLANQFIHDNFDTQEPFRRWTYIFDEQTISLNSISSIGIGSAYANGSVSTVVLDIQTGQLIQKNQ